MGLFGSHGQTTSSALVLVLVLAVLLLRNSRPRRLRIERLWVRPVIFLLLMASTLAAAPPPAEPFWWGLIAVAAAVGAALGWRRGRLMKIDVHPETHDITSRASVWGMLFILALVALRIGLRQLSQSAGEVGIPASIATDALIALGVATMVAQSLEMWLRASRLLAEARARRAGAGAPPPPSAA
ncbi:MAG TPA: hypothetical protein VGS12_17255 [Caulobacteraceae bacterium]|nr:hypothetical protein [Caulobacteraceae bacterium]